MKNPTINRSTIAASGRISILLFVVATIFAGAILFSPGTTATNAVSTCAAVPPNLISWYRGENNANDFVGTNHGTLQNGVTFAPGTVGQAFSFDGVDGMVNVPFTSVFNVASAVTIEAWVKTTSTVTGDHKLIAGRPGNYQLAKLDDGRVAFAVVIGGQFINAFSSTTLAANTLTHVAGTYDAATGLVKIYVDGSLTGTTVTAGNPDSGAQPFQIGGFGGTFVSNQFINNFGGEIDDVSLYNRALSASEIQSIFDANDAGKCVPCTPLPSNAVSWYRGEGNANDQHGNNNGTLQNGATVAPGKVGQAFSFDGVNDFVDIANTTSLDFGAGNFSIEFWANLNSLSTDQMLFHKISGTGASFNDPSYFVEFDQPNALRFRIGEGFLSNSNDLIVPTSLTAGQWFHVAAVRNGDLIQIYLNGVLAGSQTLGSNINTGAGGDAAIGRCLTGDAGCARFVNGKIDEVSLYNRALSASEIQAIFNADSAGICLPTCTPPPSSLVSWYRGEGTANDSQGTNHGTLVNGAGFAAAVVNQGFNLDGVNDFVRIGNPPSLNFGTGDFSVQAWVKTSFLGGTFNDYIISKSNVGNDAQFILSYNAGGTGFPSFRMSDGTTISHASGTANLADGTFHHLAGVREGTTLRLYVDGVQVGTATTPSLVNATSANNVVIGGRDNPDSDPYFKGIIDEVQFFNRALSASEIEAIFNAGSAGMCFNPFVVTNTNDSGVGSLRQAILNANATPDTQTVSFNIPGAPPFTISPTSSLPIITDPVILDGTTQPSYAGSPVIELAGASSSTLQGTGFHVLSHSTTIKGFVINRFNAAIALEAFGGNNIVQGNYIGTNVAGNAARPNGHGIIIGSPANLIGGNTALQRNVISGNETGIKIFQSVTSRSTNDNVIKGNYIGTSANGSAELSNDTGIYIERGRGTLVGGLQSGEGNLISGNNVGIRLLGSASIRGNLIGTSATGIDALPNSNGVFVDTSPVFITATSPIEGNTIAFNTARGIGVYFLSHTTIRGNSIHSNGTMGIDVGAFGVNLNDPCDSDSGSGVLSGAVNFPVLVSVNSSGGNTTIGGTYDGRRNQTYEIDLYSNPIADPTGYGEGQNYLGSTTVTTPDVACSGNNNTPFSVTLPVTVPPGHKVTATATNPAGTTSEFSAFKGPSANIEGTVLGPNNQPLPGAKVRLQNTTFGTQHGAITDTISSKTGRFKFSNQQLGHNYVVTVTKTNLDFAPPSRTYTNLTTNQDHSYSGTVATHEISGQVTLSGSSLGSVNMTLSGASSATTKTNNSGNYSLNNLLPGTYTITPSRADYVFTPPSTTLTINGDQTVNFTAADPQASLTGRIVFTDGFTLPINTLNAMNANGSGLAIIALDLFSLISSSNLSFDGQEIVSASFFGVAVRNFDGSNLTGILSTVDAVTVQNNFTPSDIVWSYDKAKIAFVRTSVTFPPPTNQAVHQGRIQVMNRDGSNRTGLRPFAEVFNDRSPSFSPDNTKVVFAGAPQANAKRQIHTVDFNPTTNQGTNPQRLTNNAFEDYDPAWSPNGNKIAFARIDTAGNYSIVVINADGSNETTIVPPTSAGLGGVCWSPNSTRVLFSRGNLVSVFANGTGGEIDLGPGGKASWGKVNSVLTPIGTPVTIGSGLITMSFSSVTGLSVAGGANGETVVTPISPTSAGDAPSGYNLSNYAYEINTTANYTPPVTVCFNLEAGNYSTQAQFDRLRVLHGEGETLIDRTVLPNDFANRKVCASVNSFSPFVLAELENPAMPSVTGLVVDENGNPLTDIPVALSGDETRLTSTNIDGIFAFSNMIQDGNYIVQPTRTGYLFNFPYQSYLGITGEETVVFTATAANFSIGGTVSDGNGQPVAGATINLNGTVELETTADVNGNYSFVDLPANGSYSVTPSANGFIFSPGQFTVDALQGNLMAVNFTASQACSFTLAPTSQNFASAGGANSFTVTASESACEWTAVGNDSWITIDSGTPGTGNGTVNYTVGANPGPARNGSISAGGQTFSVTQGADCIAVSIPTGLSAPTGSSLTVPVTVGDVTGRGITSFDFTLNYDPAVLSLAAIPFSTAGTLSNGYTITVNSNTQGTLVVSGFGTLPLTGLGTLINFHFNMNGSAPACSTLTLASFTFNEGTPCVMTSNGQACAVTGTISGVVTYPNSPTITPVPNTTLTVTGATSLNTSTDGNGLYSLTGFNTGAHTVTPSKTGDVNGITAFDSGLIAQHVVGLITLSGTQQIASDVSNNGVITSFDASQIAQYVVGIPNPSSTATWKFAPPDRAYPSVSTNQPNENYQAILMGEVSGNWIPPSSLVNPGVHSPQCTPIAVTLPSIAAASGSVATISLTTGDLSGQGVISYQFDLNFNSSVVQPRTAPIDVVGTLSDGMSVTVNSSSPGLLRLAVFGSNTLSNSGALLKLNFDVVGAAGTNTPLSISNFIFNEGLPASTSNNGSVTVSTPTAANGNVSGQILDNNGNPVEGAAVRMSGTQNRLTITDGRGNYRFDNVETSGFYTVTPARVNFTFSPSQRSFSQLGQQTEAAFTASANGGNLNPLDTTEYLVRQQYVDFLGREPDEPGFNFWVNNIEACGGDTQCREVVRINTSAAFFLSIEFQHTGYLVHRLYLSAYGNIPGGPVPVTLGEFRADSQAIGTGVVVNKIGWQELLESNKQAFAAEFVQRSRFLTAFPASLTPALFVDTLNQTAGNPLAQSERDQLVNELTNGVKTRAQVLRAVAEDSDLNTAEFNRAFVLMQYFGYLRRNPNDAPELGLNFDGYNFWLNKLNQFNGNFIDAEMVKAFITSGEYRQRFRPN